MKKIATIAIVLFSITMFNSMNAQNNNDFLRAVELEERPVDEGKFVQLSKIAGKYFPENDTSFYKRAYYEAIQWLGDDSQYPQWHIETYYGFCSSVMGGQYYIHKNNVESKECGDIMLVLKAALKVINGYCNIIGETRNTQKIESAMEFYSKKYNEYLAEEKRKEEIAKQKAQREFITKEKMVFE